MHQLEPYFNWRNLYTAEEDELSPFFGREYSEFEFTDRIYDHYIHPQWDNIDSPTLFMKVLFADYDDGYAVLEFIGEWNDCLYNDIMMLKRNVVDMMLESGIYKYILIGENVLNFHPSDDSYYEEWFEEVEDGWIALLNFRDHVMEDFQRENIDQYFVMGGKLNEVGWRTFQPRQLFEKIEHLVARRLGMPVD
ncbi:MAG: hypothetical protein ACFB10_03830 [Salibacteraceae bacterium]